MKPLPALLAVAFAALTTGCATNTLEGDNIALVMRGSDAVSRGDISSTYPRLRTMVIDIDRRTYAGNIETTAPNDSFDFARRYGPFRGEAVPAATAGRNSYFKAILSSADKHLLRCDLMQREDQQRSGLCADDFGNIYDVLPTR